MSALNTSTIKNADVTALKIGIEPKRLLLTSEPYVIFTPRGYQAVVDVIERRTKREHYIYLGSKSIAQPLEQLKAENGGKVRGLEIWLRKESAERLSKYILEE